jgi:hypothetical protein
MIKKFVSSVVVIALIIMTSGVFSPLSATAATITTATDTMSRLKPSTASDHTFLFVLPGGLTSGQNMTLTFAAGFTGIASMVAGDFDFAEGNTGVCSSATFTEKSIKASPTASDFSVAGAGQVVTVTSGGASATVAAGHCVRLKAGLNATDTTGGTGPGTHQITNGSLGNYAINIGGSIADSGQITVALMDDDSVSVSASVLQTLSFDLDVGTATGENGPTYQVPLNTLSASTVTHSDNSSIKSIFADGGTNSSGGMNVSVRNANGNQGLKSTSVGTDYIGSTSGAMSVGNANYGLCVATSTLSGFSKSAGYTTTCAAASGTNTIVGLTSTAADILTSSAPVAAGHAEIIVNAEISNATPAHTDYTDTLTFIATASF